MTGYLLFIAVYFIGWVLFFMCIQKPVFLIYNRRSAKGALTGKNLRDIYRHGFRTETVAAAYLTALPILAGAIQMFVPYHFLSQFMVIYNIVVAVALGLLVVADTALYDFWQFKIEVSVLSYLQSLKGAFASVSTVYIIGAFSAWALMSCVTYFWSWLFSLSGDVQFFYMSGWQMAVIILILLVVAAIDFIIIRGLAHRPLNPSVSFFSTTLFLNHAALNPLYNFIHSATVKDKIRGAFHFFDDEQCEREFRELFPVNAKPTEKLFNTDRPNVLMVIWESLGAKFMSEFGADPAIMPNLNRLAKEGILFTHVASSSFRTNRAIVAILSGYPGQPTTSVIRMTKKLPNLPALPRVFKDAGYHTSIVHGGDLAIFHKAEYYMTVGHDTIIGEQAFPTDWTRGKWGIHDGHIMEWLYEDIVKKTAVGERWYTTFQTLSSHEPWVTPYDPLKSENEIHNAYAYVDAEFGKFIDRLKKSPAWKDLLIVIVGDHGANVDAPPHHELAHIPVIFLGGAVKEPRKIDTVMSQTDLAATLLGQLALPREDFIFSRDVFAPTYTYPFSFHTFINGLMFTDDTGYTVIDTVADTAVENPDSTREHIGRVILQYLYKDLSER